jgi:hypothetical protein
MTLGNMRDQLDSLRMRAKLLKWRGGHQNLSGDSGNVQNEGKFQNLLSSQVTGLASPWNMLRGKLSRQSRLLKEYR